MITSSRCTLHVYLNRFVSELDSSPAETLENHHFSAEIAILKYDTVCSYACSAQKFSSAVGKSYIDGILSSSAFQRGAVHVVQTACGRQPTYTYVIGYPIWHTPRCGTARYGTRCGTPDVAPARCGTPMWPSLCGGIWPDSAT